MRFFLYIIFFYFSDVDASNLLTKDNVIDRIKTEIIKKFPNADIDITLDSWKELEINEVTNIQFYENYNRFSVSLIGKQEQKLNGKILWMVDIPVLNKNIKSSEIIKEDDINFEKKPLSLLNDKIITKKEDLIGKTPKMALLRASIPIKSNEIQNPIIVKKGDRVQVLYKSPTLLVTNEGIAQADASIGDMIFVEVSPSKKPKKIRARLISHSQAEIIL